MTDFHQDFRGGPDPCVYYIGFIEWQAKYLVPVGLHIPTNPCGLLGENGRRETREGRDAFFSELKKNLV